VATQEAETGRLTVQSQPEQIVRETQSQKIPSQKRAGGVAQGVSPVFKSQYQKKKTPELWIKIRMQKKKKKLAKKISDYSRGRNVSCQPLSL
jgi:hypothetical protein